MFWGLSKNFVSKLLCFLADLSSSPSCSLQPPLLADFPPSVYESSRSRVLVRQCNFTGDNDAPKTSPSSILLGTTPSWGKEKKAYVHYAITVVIEFLTRTREDLSPKLSARVYEGGAFWQVFRVFPERKGMSLGRISCEKWVLKGRGRAHNESPVVFA